MVGMPGAGISAFFYLLLVLLMPFRLIWLLLRRSGLHDGHFRLIVRQLLIGIGILASFVLIGLGLELVAPSQEKWLAASALTGFAATAVGGVLKLGALLAVATLFGVLVFVQTLSLVLRGRSAPSAPVPTRLVDTRMR